MSERQLSVVNHDRDAAGLTYVYPVVSRRAGGVSVGINLNPNNACNWRCVYCQVPNLTRGNGPQLDLGLLERELNGLLEDIQHGDFMQRRVPEGARALKDIALSGNGEPTTSPQFAEVVALLERVLTERGLRGELPCTLITNGSMANKPHVLQALERFATFGGVVWFKLDRVTREGMQAVNGGTGEGARQVERLRAVSAVCPTWIQTCVFGQQPIADTEGAPELAATNERGPSDAELSALLDVFGELAQQKLRLPLKLNGVLLYGLARPSEQPEAARLVALPAERMRDIAARIEAVGLPVQLSV
ncbi:MAG: radical SAM protein [Polyangiaceae bacterium]